jgi:LCP family protein required for cell wall assembly
MKDEERLHRRRVRRAWTAAGVVALLVTALVVAVFFVRPFGKRSETGEPWSTQQAEVEAPMGVSTFLVLGVDQRPGDVGRADTMIVGSYDAQRERLTMISIPRDTYTYVKGHDYTKINHSFAYGGTTLTINTVEQLIGLPIDHYVQINFQGFMKFINALGGIDIDAEKRMYYVDPEDRGMGPNGLVIDIQPGPQHMDGYNTLAYARFRKDEEGDRGRMRRQQQVIEAVVHELNQPATFAKIPKLIPAVFNTVETDLTMAQMISYALSGKEAMAKGITASAIKGADMTLDGIYYLVPNLVELRTLVYTTLMGTEPPAEYLVKAEADQRRLAQVVSRETGKYTPRSTGTGTSTGAPANTGTGAPVGSDTRTPTPGASKPASAGGTTGTGTGAGTSTGTGTVTGPGTGTGTGTGSGTGTGTGTGTGSSRGTRARPKTRTNTGSRLFPTPTPR